MNMKLKLWLIFTVLTATAVLAGVTGVVYACPEPGGGGGCQRLDLKLKDQDEFWRDGVHGTWTAANMAPGDEYLFEGSFVGLRSNTASMVRLTCDYRVTEEQPAAEPDTDPQTNLHPDSMAKQMALTRCVYKTTWWQIDCLTGAWQITSGGRAYSGCNSRWQIDDVDGDGNITFYDLKYDPVACLPLPDARITDSTRFEIGVRFGEAAGNEFQGDTLDMSMLYTAAAWDNRSTADGISLRDYRRFFNR